MSTMDISNMDSPIISPTVKKSILGNIIIVAPHDPQIQRKINRIETVYKDQIVSKNQHFQGDNLISFLIFEGDIQDFQNFVVEVNGIKELKNFRYLIVN
jgi:metal-responsive CopG/Arc/MetJ family transcriptional regulator